MSIVETAAAEAARRGAAHVGAVQLETGTVVGGSQGCFALFL